MKLLSSELGITSENFFCLSATTEAGNPLAVKTTPKIQRIEKEKLEQLYISDPIIFNSINKVVQIIMAAGYRLYGPDEIVSFFQEFFQSIGEKGSEYEWDSLLEIIFKHTCVYGNAWIEKIYNKQSTHIVDLDYIDPKKMDFARDSIGNIVVDKNNNPVGYTYKLPFEVEAVNKFSPPKEVMLPPNSVFIPPERVVHFQLYTIGEGFDGIGLIEPIYKTALRRANMEEALANSWWLTGFPLKKGKVGDLNHEPTEEQLASMAETIKNLDYRSSIVVPYYADVEILEAKHPEKLKEQLGYFIDEEIAGLGLPKAYALGSGEATNRATLARQEYLLKLSLRDITNRVCRMLELKLFKEIARQNRLKTYPKIKWGEVALEELDSKAKRIVSYATAGLLTPDIELERYIRKAEDLPEKTGVK